MRVLVLLMGFLAAVPGWAQEPWVLQSGPSAVESVPLDPVQLVPSWRALYTRADERVWVYATASPHFTLTRAPEVRALTGTPWTAIFFFPQGWKPAARTPWMDLWEAEFRSLSSLPDPGWPLLFPAVLTKG